MMTVLGIDPGLASTGYGLISVDGSRMRCIDYGVVTTSSDLDIGARLLLLYDSLKEIIASYSPAEAGMESLYFTKNVTSALLVARAMGVAILALEQAAVPVSEYGPRQIKQAIVGNGRAEKAEIQEFLKLLLGMSERPSPDHAADALAVAICHRNTSVVTTKAQKAR